VFDLALRMPQAFAGPILQSLFCKAYFARPILQRLFCGAYFVVRKQIFR
jgi:hypothetical protein